MNIKKRKSTVHSFVCVKYVSTCSIQEPDGQKRPNEPNKKNDDSKERKKKGRK